MQTKRMWMNGKWVLAQFGEVRSIINPFNQEVIAEVAEGGRKDARMAIKAARKAFDKGNWLQMTAPERGKKLFQLAQLIQENKQDLARMEILNPGKTLVESEADMDHIAGVFHYYAGLADKDGGEMLHPPVQNAESKVVREPAGERLVRELNIPSLSEQGADPKQIDRYAKAALDDPQTFGNSRGLNLDAYQWIYRLCFGLEESGLQ